MRKDQFLVLQELLSSLKSRKWKFRYRPYVSPISTVKRSLDTVSSTAVVAPDSNCNIRHGPRRTMVSRALRQTLWFRSWPFFFGLEERTFTALTDLVYIYLNFFLGFPRLFMCVVFNLTSFGFSCLIKVLHLKEVIWFLNAQKYNSFHFPFTLKAHISSLSRLALFLRHFHVFCLLCWAEFSRAVRVSSSVPSFYCPPHLLNTTPASFLESSGAGRIPRNLPTSPSRRQFHGLAKQRTTPCGIDFPAAALSQTAKSS